MAFTVYRLVIDDPEIWNEQMGDPVTNQGGAAVPAVRSALRHSVTIPTFTPVAGDTIAQRLKLRRQLRSLLNNTPMKLTGLYVDWDADSEQNGWYTPDQGQLVDGGGASTGLSTGYWKVESFVFFLGGHIRTHRRAMWVYLKDLRAGISARDYKRNIFSTDFSGLTALPLTYLGSGVTDAMNASNGAVAPLLALPVGADGGAPNLLTTVVPTDLMRVSYEQPESSRNLAQVIAYDRRGTFTAPANGPDPAWEEIYGPDYPYSWVAATPTVIDTPVLDNGQCRVRFDSAGTDGFAVDVWVAGSGWVEQGTIIIERSESGGTAYDASTLSASIVEYNETRAVMQVVMAASGLPASREVVYITLQRGWRGPRVEVYPALDLTGGVASAGIQFEPAAIDSDDSVIKIDAAGAGSILATAMGTGHTGLLASGTLGASTFTGENWVLIGRWGAAYGVVIAVLQAGAQAKVGNDTQAYGGANRNAFLVGPAAFLGYASAHFAFPAQFAQQALEAESMTLGTGTSSVSDAAASGGFAASANRATDANPHVTQATWPNSHAATYRVFARVKTGAGTLNVYAKTTATTGATKTTTSTSYVWLDLGDIVSVATTLEIHCWCSGATVFVDRIEAFSLGDVPPVGGRDLGQSILYDSRTIPTLVTRST